MTCSFSHNALVEIKGPFSNKQPIGLELFCWHSVSTSHWWRRVIVPAAVMSASASLETEVWLNALRRLDVLNGGVGCSEAEEADKSVWEKDESVRLHVRCRWVSGSENCLLSKVWLQNDCWGLSRQAFISTSARQVSFLLRNEGDVIWYFCFEEQLAFSLFQILPRSWPRSKVIPPFSWRKRNL